MPIDLVSGIVQILGYNGITVGTGFIVSNSGLIATCAHVVQAAKVNPTGKLTVLFQECGGKCNASVILKWWSSSDNKDIAILQLEHETPEGVQVLPLGTSKGTDNHEVEAFGFPDIGTLNGLWGKGTVYKRVTDRRGNTLLQINSSEITAGFSGSPLLDNSKQRVIGMIVSIAKEDTYSRLRDTAFAVPIETLQSICPTLKIEDMCPYRGLLPFTEEDQEFFFGRDKLVQDLMNQLRSNPRFLALVGSSGSGKSSVISGGLLPRIRRDEILGFENAQIITFRPGIDPNQSLKREVDLFISTGKLDLWDKIRVYLQKEPDKRLVIFADQFEELFTISLDNERSQFIGNFIRLLESGLKISLILTIRADFYSFLLESEFGKYLSTGQINVRPMSKEEIEQAIEKPAEAIGLQIESGLTNLIITDLKDTKDPLPLLEFTLTKLWERCSDALLTHDTYSKLGGVTGAIGQWANETYNGLTDKEKELARRIFTRLIHYGESGTPDSRRRLPLIELAESEDKETIHKLITKLADVHLLVTDRESNTGIETAEIVHDSLLTEWGQLKEWIKDHHTFLLWRQRLEYRINEWHIRDKDAESLLRGAALVEASEWNGKRKKELNQNEKEYIKNSLELREREQELKEKERLAEIQRKRNTIRALSIITIVILFLAGFATYEWNQTYKQKQLAEEKTKEARLLYLNSQSSILGESAVDLDKSILLAVESFRIRRTSDADRLIRQSLPLIPHKIIVVKCNDSVDNVAFSPNGKYIATTNFLDEARLWDISTGKEVRVTKHDSIEESFAFSPDGKYIAAACTDNITRLWDISTGKEVRIMKNDNFVVNAAFSPDGKYIAAESGFNTVRLWDISTGKKVTAMKRDIIMWDFAFSPDGKYIATTSDEKTIKLWNVSTGEEVRIMKNDNFVVNAAFSPDGKYIAAMSGSNTVRLWDISTGKKVTSIKHDNVMLDFAFSPNGKYIATISDDKTARLWDIPTGEEVTVMKHDDMVNDVAFSPDGKYIATASDDKTARLWDAFTDGEINLKNAYLMRTEVSFSPDGKYIAAVSDDKTARLWDVSTGKEINAVQQEDIVNDVAFSPDGKYIATASDDKTAQLWNLSTGKEINAVQQEDIVNDVAFSPDGKYIATASDDKTARLWDVSTGKEVTVMKHENRVNDVAFSSDGKYIATASTNNTSWYAETVQLWDVSTGKGVGVMKQDNVSNFAFSPDGKYIAIGIGGKPPLFDFSTGKTVSDDNTSWYAETVQLWDVSTGKGVGVMKQDNVSNFAFSPDGKYIATASYDKIARLWDVSTGKEVSIMKPDDYVHNFAFSPDGKYIATVSDDIIRNKYIRTLSDSNSHEKNMQTVSLWDLSTGKEINAVQQEDIVNDVAFSPDGKYIATASDDKTARLWDALTGEEITVMKFDDKVDDIAFSPDGKYIAAVSEGNTIRLWEWNTEDLISEASNRLTRNLTPQEWKKYMGSEPYHKTFPNLP